MRSIIIRRRSARVFRPERIKQLAASLVGQIFGRIRRDVAEVFPGLAHLLHVHLATVARAQMSFDHLTPLLVKGTLEVVGDQFDQVYAFDVCAPLVAHVVSPE